VADYYLAPSLVRLRAEMNARWPDRDRLSDGWIADAAHNARTSDHNADPHSTPPGVVRAVDVDKDGIDAMGLVLAAIAHPATNYVIFNGSIWSRAYQFRRRVYTGVNRHDKHVHISILKSRAAEYSTRAWLVSALSSAATAPRPATSYSPADVARPITIPEDDVTLTKQQDEALAAVWNLLCTPKGRGAQAIDRILGTLPQRWWVNRDGKQVGVAAGTAGAQPARVLDSLDGNYLLEQMVAARDRGVAETSAAYHQLVKLISDQPASGVDVDALADRIIDGLGPQVAAATVDALAARLTPKGAW